jgi:hypothetical protein
MTAILIYYSRSKIFEIYNTSRAPVNHVLFIAIWQDRKMFGYL